jgi:glycogen(starch) synthase
MKRILMTSDAVGGVWTYTLELVRALGAQGVEVCVAVMGREPGAEQQRDFEKLENAALKPAPFALEWEDNPWGDVDAASGWLLDLADEFAPDVVHLNGYAHATLPWDAPVLVAAHSCVQTWWRAVRGERAPAQFAEYRRRVLAGLQAADLVVTPTHAFRAGLESEYHLHLPGPTIHNARDGAHFMPGEKQPLIFSAGRIWDQAKNLALLDRIASQLPWEVHIAGESGHQEIQTDGVSYLGCLPSRTVADQLSRAAIYAAPALYEPFGLSILEAALSGCALVLSDLPTLRELWDGCARFVPVNDETAWIAALNEVAGDSLQRAELQAYGSERARQFTPARQVAAYLELYRRLARHEPAAALA